MSSKSSQNEEKEQTRKRSSKERRSALKSVVGTLSAVLGAKPSISEVPGGGSARAPRWTITAWVLDRFPRKSLVLLGFWLVLRFLRKHVPLEVYDFIENSTSTIRKQSMSLSC